MIRRGSFFACLLLGATVAAVGQTRDQNWEKCKAEDPDTSIAGCTALIQAGQESTVDLASAYFDRGIAYRDKKEYDLALQDLDQALKLKPDFAGALNTRQCLQRQGPGRPRHGRLRRCDPHRPELRAGLL